MTNADNDRSKTLSELCADLKEITVGFIGGSITEQDKYRVYVMDYLRKTYPNNVFTEVGAGIGGTGSGLGVLRMDHDLLWRNPDIVFIEFSVNDVHDSLSARMSMEGMIRKTLRQNAGAIIAVLGTATTDSFSDYDKGNLPGAVFAHKEVAEYYNIPYINMGKVLYDHIKATGTPVTDYLPDNVHPNYEGGKIYADEIIKYLADYKWDIDYKDEPMTENLYENADLYIATDYLQAPWTGVPERGVFSEKLGKYIASSNVGDTLEFDFYGMFFGVLYGMCKNSGMFELSIDGGEWIKVNCWDTYCLDFDRAAGGLVVSGLDKTDHHVVLRVSEEKEELSTGHKIVISAFFWERKEVDYSKYQ